MHKSDSLIFGATLVFCLLLPGCHVSDPIIEEPVQKQTVPVVETIDPPMGTNGYPWWNDTVFYQIFTRNFYDHGSDSIGDLKGIIEKLDYLQELGVTGIYLMPIHPSGDPSVDSSGYRVEDYLAVNQDFGTIADFKDLVSEVHRKGMRIIIDLVLNHTSDRHPWFTAAQDLNSPYRDYYIWSENKPDFRGAWGQEVWFEGESGYYFATFGEHFPDLNYDNPAVTREFEQIAKYWLVDIGVDGFRLDAAKHLIEEDPQNQVHTASTHAWYKDFRQYIKSLDSDALIAGEVWDVDPSILASYTGGDELDLTWEFGISQAITDSVRSGNNSSIKEVLEQSYQVMPDLQFITFLSNQDMARVMTQLGNDEEKAKIATSILLTIPGVPCMYNGEEIGMQGEQENYYESLLIPMQWSDEDNSPSWKEGWESVSPDYLSYNVADEINNPDSILAHYRMLIDVRNQHSSLRVGDFHIISTSNSSLFSFLRNSAQESVLVIVNLTDQPITDYHLSLKKSPLAAGTYTAVSLIEETLYEQLSVDSKGSFTHYLPSLEILPYSTLLIALTLS